MDWKEFFKKYGCVGINRFERVTQPTVEQLYQAFKARLMDEQFQVTSETASLDITNSDPIDMDETIKKIHSEFHKAVYEDK